MIEIGRPFARPITPPSPTAKVSGPAYRKLAVDRRLRTAAADGPSHGLDLAFQGERLAGSHDALEAHVVDAREQCELAAVLRLRQHSDRAALRERLDHLHAGHDRIAREVARAIVRCHGLPGDDAFAGNELEHLVDEQHRIAMRQYRLDRRLVHERHAAPLSLSRKPLRPRCA